MAIRTMPVADIVSRLSTAPRLSRVSSFHGRVTVGFPTQGHDDDARPLLTGIVPFDERFGGLPRGCLTELVGTVSSGKLWVLFSVLRRVLSPSESRDGGGLVALVDVSGTVFPDEPWAQGRLLVVRPRCMEDALRAVDVLVSSAALELIALEASGCNPRRMPGETAAVRLGRIARETGTAIVACGERSLFGSHAALRMELVAQASGELRITVCKNRRGPLGAMTLERPGFPFAAASRRPAAFAQPAGAPLLPLAESSLPLAESSLPLAESSLPLAESSLPLAVP